MLFLCAYEKKFKNWILFIPPRGYFNVNGRIADSM
jgi:hypothetical protein